MSDGNKYSENLFAWMQAEGYSSGIETNNAGSGQHSWNQLVQAYGNSAGADADLRDTRYNIICSTVFQVNDYTDFHNQCAEAILRVLLTADPTKRMIVVLAPKVDAGLTTVQPLEAWQAAEVAMYKTYVDNVIFMDVRQECIDNPALIPVYMADTLHFSAAGHVHITDVITADWTATPTKYTADRSGVLPSRTFACENYEYAPTIVAGNANDGETGSWSSTGGTERHSSTVGSTITFHATCVSFGVYYNTTEVDVSIDGGAFVRRAIGTNGIPLTEFGVSNRANHTVVLKVVTTLSVTQAWFI